MKWNCPYYLGAYGFVCVGVFEFQSFFFNFSFVLKFILHANTLSMCIGKECESPLTPFHMYVFVFVTTGRCLFCFALFFFLFYDWGVCVCVWVCVGVVYICE